ncbi:MAG TPA: DNA repair exonuclease [Thermomicrobiaceae bacterium]|nr:DNA repair exonuclease [Thermomicrobiaceae bacterium]
MSTVRVLCTGDVHIGQRSTRLPAGLDPAPYSCATAWSRVVDRAIRERVDLVAISGDLIDQLNNTMEALGPLESGLKRLASHGIECLAVAGNHDAIAAGWLARVDGLGLRLLGRGGHWERYTLRRVGEDRLHVDGWSFPVEHVNESPLGDYQLPAGEHVPVLGMIHGDLDQPVSSYCPLMAGELRRLPVDFWLLGHIHVPASFEAPGAATILYPGSPQAAHPGETGRHGPWLIEFDGRHVVSPRQFSGSTVRYTAFELEISPEVHADAMTGWLYRELREAVEHELAAPDEELRCLVCRLIVSGRTSRLPQLQATLAQLETDDVSFDCGEVRVHLEQAISLARPAIDLEAMSHSNTLPGEVARLILALNQDSIPDEYLSLTHSALDSLHDVNQLRTFVALTDGEPDERLAQGYLRQEAWRLLDELVRQKEPA